MCFKWQQSDIFEPHNWRWTEAIVIADAVVPFGETKYVRVHDGDDKYEIQYDEKLLDGFKEDEVITLGGWSCQKKGGQWTFGNNY